MWIGKGSFFDHSPYPSIHPHIKADQYAFFNTLFLSYLYAYSKLHLPMFSAPHEISLTSGGLGERTHLSTSLEKIPTLRYPRTRDYLYTCQVGITNMRFRFEKSQVKGTPLVLSPQNNLPTLGGKSVQQFPGLQLTRAAHIPCTQEYDTFCRSFKQARHLPIHRTERNLRVAPKFSQDSKATRQEVSPAHGIVTHMTLHSMQTPPLPPLPLLLLDSCRENLTCSTTMKWLGLRVGLTSCAQGTCKIASSQLPQYTRIHGKWKKFFVAELCRATALMELAHTGVLGPNVGLLNAGRVSKRPLAY